MGDAVFTILGNTTGGAVHLYLPRAESVPGRIYTVKNVAAGNNLVLYPASDGDDTIDGASYLYLSTLYDFAIVQSSGLDWYIISTNL